MLLRKDQEDLAAVAGRVAVFNDSCHSGGAVTKAFGAEQAEDDMQPKTYPAVLHEDALAKSMSPADAVAAEATCARASNAPANAAAKALRSVAPADKLVYLAAAAEDQVAFTNAKGSLATRAWHHCLRQPDTDLNRDGYVSGQELSNCANTWLKAEHPRWRQTVNAQLSIGLPIAPTPQSPRR